MSFYIIPPTSTGRLERLILDVKIRLQLLYLLVQCKRCKSALQHHMQDVTFAQESDGLIEHTCRDKNSHFLLRSAASADLFFEKFFLQSEVLLFEYRLKCSQGSLRFNISKLLTELQQSRTTLAAWSDHGRDFAAASSVAEDVLQFACIDQEARCGKCSVRVAWEQVPDLVAARAVAVERGVCSISCRDTIQLLSQLFLRLLTAGVADMSQSGQMCRLELAHPALHNSLQRIVTSFMSSHHLTSSSSTALSAHVAPLKAGEILSASRRFPPCMAQLQQLLTKHRRLPHHQRYRYSVFLRSIGVPLQENILFWQGHYTAAAHEHSACGHHWGRDGARYVYSLRHLYGLEGRRRPALPHTCHQLQSMSAQPGDCGGCPFAVVASMASKSPELSGAAATQSCQSKLSSPSVVLSRASSGSARTARLLSTARDVNRFELGRDFENEVQNEDTLRQIGLACENPAKIPRRDMSASLRSMDDASAGTSAAGADVRKFNLQRPETGDSGKVKPALGCCPTYRTTEKVTKTRETLQKANDLREVRVDASSEIASLSHTSFSSRHMADTNARKVLIQSNSFGGMNDQVQTEPHHENSLPEIPRTSQLGCGHTEFSVVHAAYSVNRELGLQSPGKLNVSSVVKTGSKASNSFPIDDETANVPSTENGLKTSLYSENQCPSNKKSSFFLREQSSNFDENTDISKPLFLAARLHSTSLSPGLSVERVVPYSTSSSSLVPSSHSLLVSSDPVSSLVSCASRLVSISSSPSVFSSANEGSVVPSWSTTRHPIPSCSISSRATPTPLPPELAMSSPWSASLDTLLRTCGVRCRSVREDIIRVACDGHASFACRLTLAALLDQAASETRVIKTAVNNGKNGGVPIGDCSGLSDEKLTEKVESVELLQQGKLDTGCSVHRKIENFPSNKEKDKESSRSCPVLAKKRKWTPSNHEDAQLDTRKKLNGDFVGSNLAVDRNYESEWFFNIEHDRLHFNKENFRNSFECSESKSRSNSLNVLSNRGRENLSGCFCHNESEGSFSHRIFCRKFDSSTEVKNSLGNDRAADVLGNENMSVHALAKLNDLGRKKSAAHSSDLNFYGKSIPGENNSSTAANSDKIRGRGNCDDDVTQRNLTMDDDISIVWMNLKKSSSKACLSNIDSLKNLAGDKACQGTVLTNSTELDQVIRASPDMFASSLSCSVQSDLANNLETHESDPFLSQRNSAPEISESETRAEAVQNLKMSPLTPLWSTENPELRSLGSVTSPSASAASRCVTSQTKDSLQFASEGLEITNHLKISSKAESIVSKYPGKASLAVSNPVNLTLTKASQTVKLSEGEPLSNSVHGKLEKVDYSDSFLPMSSKDRIRKLLCRTQSFCEPTKHVNVTFGCKKQKNGSGATRTSKKSKPSSSHCTGETKAQCVSENMPRNVERTANDLLCRRKARSCIDLRSKWEAPPLSTSSVNGVISQTSVASYSRKSTSLLTSSFMDREKNYISSRSSFLEQRNGKITHSFSSSTSDGRGFRPDVFSTQENFHSRDSSSLSLESKTKINIDLIKQHNSCTTETNVSKGPSLCSAKIENVPSNSKYETFPYSISKCVASLEPETDRKSIIGNISSPSEVNSDHKSINETTPLTLRPKACCKSFTSACSKSVNRVNSASVPTPAIPNDPTDNLDPWASDSRVTKEAADFTALDSDLTASWMCRARNPVDASLNFSSPRQYYHLLRAQPVTVSESCSSEYSK